MVHKSPLAYSLKTAGKSMGASLEGWKTSEIAIRKTSKGRVAAPILVVVASELPPSRRRPPVVRHPSPFPFPRRPEPIAGLWPPHA